MCPGHVPGSRSDTVSERSTTLILASPAKSKSSPSKPFEVPCGIEAQLFKVSDHLDLRVAEYLVDHTLRDVQVLQVKRVRDADEARLLGGNTPVAADGRPERLLVAGEYHGHLRPLDKRAGNDVGVHGFAFDLVREALRRQVGEAYPEGVAVRFLAEVADDQVFDSGLFRLLHAEDAEAADHVRVHPRPRVVLAQSVDVEHVDVREGKSRHHPHVLGEELGLAPVHLIRRYRLDYGRLVVGILDGRHAEEDVARGEHLVRDLDHEVADALDAVAVQRERLLVLAEPDRGHLHEAALYIGAEVRVRFDPVDEHNAVGLEGDPVHVHGHPSLRLPELYDLHRGTYRRPTKFLRNTQRLQDLHLSLGRGPAMAPHRGHDKGLCLHLFQDRDERAQDL